MKLNNKHVSMVAISGRRSVFARVKNTDVYITIAIDRAGENEEIHEICLTQQEAIKLAQIIKLSARETGGLSLDECEGVCGN